MSRDRLTQLVAAVLLVASLLGAAVVSPRVVEQRKELQIEVSGAGDASMYHVLTASLGSFRGIAINAFWYRSEQLKREGKYFEANTLAEWITTLQPRFPQVWAFQAWNMAYNISVATHTPEERWDWVRKGVRLLADEGIPNNPDGVGLYRMLSWIYFHKIAGYTDDMNWYYKAQMAEEYGSLLGTPTEGTTTEQALARFKPIADMGDKYFITDRGPSSVLVALDDIAEANPDLASRIRDIRWRPPTPLRQALVGMREDLGPDRRELAEQIEGLIKQIDDRQAGQAREALTQLLEDGAEDEDEVDVRPLVEALRKGGVPLNPATTSMATYSGIMRKIGAIQMQTRYRGADALRELLIKQGDTSAVAALDALVDPQYRDQWPKLKNFLRAGALVRDYHMDPWYMYHLMEQYGPFDWRHPASHSAYWGSLGVARAGHLVNKKDVDLLNTDRQVIHSLQQLNFYGRIAYDPMTRKVDMLPDPRFIKAYDKAMDAAIARVKSGEYGAGTETSFDSGHENFLHKAALFTYLYGDEADAIQYYEKARRLYGDLRHNRARYRMPFRDFMTDLLLEDMEMGQVTRAVIESMIIRGIDRGLATGDRLAFDRFVTIARSAHANYQKERANPNPTATQQRLALPPFRTMFVNIYANYMRSPTVPLLRRARAYRITPEPLQAEAYPRFRAGVLDQVNSQAMNPQGYPLDTLFPPPPGWDEGETMQPDGGREVQTPIEVN